VVKATLQDEVVPKEKHVRSKRQQLGWRAARSAGVAAAACATGASPVATACAARRAHDKRTPHISGSRCWRLGPAAWRRVSGRWGGARQPLPAVAGSGA
jgi:hypothetical protein